MRIAVVLYNLGGPSSLKDIKPFLFNLFNDQRIIPLAKPWRFLLAKLISTLRTPKAAKVYHHMGGGSPILAETYSQADELAQMLATSEDNYALFTFMRYSPPFAEDVVAQVAEYAPDKVVLLPLYPQYSTTTTLSGYEEWHRAMHAAGHDWCCHVVPSYYDHPSFIRAHVELIRATYMKAASSEVPVRILFSAHGLPLSIIKKGDPYAIQVKHSAILIAKMLSLPELDFVVCYQSKVGPAKWLEPSTEHEINRARQDNVSIIVVPIAFVSDHVETLVELDIEYKELFGNNERYYRVPALGKNESFISCLHDLCISST